MRFIIISTWRELCLWNETLSLLSLSCMCVDVWGCRREGGGGWGEVWCTCSNVTMGDIVVFVQQLMDQLTYSNGDDNKCGLLLVKY